MISQVFRLMLSAQSDMDVYGPLSDALEEVGLDAAAKHFRQHLVDKIPCVWIEWIVRGDHNFLYHEDGLHQLFNWITNDRKQYEEDNITLEGSIQWENTYR